MTLYIAGFVSIGIIAMMYSMTPHTSKDKSCFFRWIFVAASGWIVLMGYAALKWHAGCENLVGDCYDENYGDVFFWSGAVVSLTFIVSSLACLIHIYFLAISGYKRVEHSHKSSMKSTPAASQYSALPAHSEDVIAQFEKIAKLLDKASGIVLITGAGVSADSGIPTFRDGMTGLWNNVNPDQVASIQGFLDKPDRVWQWHAALKTLIDQKQPNDGHYAIAELERIFGGKRFTVITQNIDGYHVKVGNSRVFEIHGSIHRLRCFRHCGFLQYWEDAKTYPVKCPSCGAAVRPDVVWFGEPLNEDLFAFAEAAVLNADIVFSVGTSLTVHPVARLPQMAKDAGARVVEVNPFETPFTSTADMSFRQGAGEFFSQLLRHITDVRNS